ncbi:hypothetical protein [Psychrobacter sanguinis]|nr:hypothetical protein [Psychrobacter sanguinis]
MSPPHYAQQITDRSHLGFCHALVQYQGSLLHSFQQTHALNMI